MYKQSRRKRSEILCMIPPFFSLLIQKKPFLVSSLFFPFCRLEIGLQPMYSIFISEEIFTTKIEQKKVIESY
jgi:hypothetical protein